MRMSSEQTTLLISRSIHSFRLEAGRDESLFQSYFRQIDNFKWVSSQFAFKFKNIFLLYFILFSALHWAADCECFNANCNLHNVRKKVWEASEKIGKKRGGNDNGKYLYVVQWLEPDVIWKSSLDAKPLYASYLLAVLFIIFPKRKPRSNG